MNCPNCNRRTFISGLLAAVAAALGMGGWKRKSDLPGVGVDLGEPGGGHTVISEWRQDDRGVWWCVRGYGVPAHYQPEQAKKLNKYRSAGVDAMLKGKRRSL